MPSYQSQSQKVLNISRVTPTSLNVSWPAWEKGRDPGDVPITGYKLYWSQLNDGPFDVLNEGEEHSYYVENLEPATYYYFKLAVIREGDHGEGQSSATQKKRTCSGRCYTFCQIYLIS